MKTALDVYIERVRSELIAAGCDPTKAQHYAIIAANATRVLFRPDYVINQSGG